MSHNQRMSEKTKRIMSERLTSLMNRPDNLNLNTLKKVSAKSGVSYGTVRRIKVADPVDVQIGHVEAVAASFGLSLIEFVSDFDEKSELTAEERQLIDNIRTLEEDDAKTKVKEIARLAMLTKASHRAMLIQPQDDQAPPSESQSA